MALYTFYPCAADGLASTFETAELASDAEADAFAGGVLEDHSSARRVIVWCGDRKVLTREVEPGHRLRWRFPAGADLH